MIYPYGNIRCLALHLPKPYNERMEECMLERLRDKIPVVRAQAARALSRLQDGGESNDFSEDAITASFVQLLGRAGCKLDPNLKASSFKF